MLETFKSKNNAGSNKCLVTITPTAFHFNPKARINAQLDKTDRMIVHIDPEDFCIVFEKLVGTDKIEGSFKLGGDRKGQKRLITKAVISNTPFIRAVAEMPLSSDRRFEMKEFSKKLPDLEQNYNGRREAWYIELRPNFEKSILAKKIGELGNNEKGIYRYRGGSNGEEIIYIGKGNIKDRYNESPRKEWNITKIEYSIIKDDKKALDWEKYWINHYKKENNGFRPIYNKQDGHEIERKESTTK